LVRFPRGVTSEAGLPWFNARSIAICARHDDPAAIGRVDQHLHRPLPVFLGGRLRR
jgi:hypothetical protein